MPNITSAKKRMRQNVLLRSRNRARRSTLRSAIKSFLQAVDSGDAAAASSQWPTTQAIIDRTARLGVIHPNTAARTKSRLSRRLQHLSS